MSTLPRRSSPLRGCRRKKSVLNLDLNIPPVPEQEGTSTQATFQPLAAVATIDVEAIDDHDDDVMVCTASAFAEAKSKSQRNRGMAIVDVESFEESMAHGHKRRRAPSVTIDFGLTINMESSGNSMVVSVEKPAPPPEEPTFSCPICMGIFVEETSTKCGHIFCKACIKAAIATQPKCPACRKRVNAKDLIRVFLPATNLI